MLLPVIFTPFLYEKNGVYVRHPQALEAFIYDPNGLMGTFNLKFGCRRKFKIFFEMNH